MRNANKINSAGASMKVSELLAVLAALTDEKIKTVLEKAKLIVAKEG